MRYFIRWTDKEGKERGVTVETLQEAEEMRQHIRSQRGFTLIEFKEIS